MKTHNGFDPDRLVKGYVLAEIVGTDHPALRSPTFLGDMLDLTFDDGRHEHYVTVDTAGRLSDAWIYHLSPEDNPMRHLLHPMMLAAREHLGLPDPFYLP